MSEEIIIKISPNGSVVEIDGQGSSPNCAQLFERIHKGLGKVIETKEKDGIHVTQKVEVGK